MARRFLLLWLALNSLAFIFAGQTWWFLQIDAGDQKTAITGSGFDSDRSISAILMFGLAALLFVAFSRGWAAVVISALAAAASLFLVGLLLMGFVAQNIGGVAQVVEKQTAITILPILSENQPNLVFGQLQAWGWLALVAVLLLATIQLTYAIRVRSWNKSSAPKADRTQTKVAQSKSHPEAEDTISLWDSQR